tara:strand:- start:72 stop:779 length:708 start_codon:yes stop_codon:yes gene_type:complete
VTYDTNTYEEWKNLLEPCDWHYHIGVNGPRDNMFENAVEKFIYPHIPDGSSVLDCGCGYGGPAKMLTYEKNCTVTCITNSKNQAKHILYDDIPVLLQDLNETLDYKMGADAAIFYESFGHITDQVSVLQRCPDKIVMVAYFSKVERFYLPEWKSLFRPLDELTALMECCGYTIDHIQDCEYEKYLIPNAAYWYSRLKDKEYDGALGVLKKWCEDIQYDSHSILDTTGLINICATR